MQLLKSLLIVASVVLISGADAMQRSRSPSPIRKKMIPVMELPLDPRTASPFPSNKRAANPSVPVLELPSNARTPTPMKHLNLQRSGRIRNFPGTVIDAWDLDRRSPSFERQRMAEIQVPRGVMPTVVGH